MKIFEVIPNLESGGAERFVIDLSNELSKSIEVILILFYSIKSNIGFYSEVNKNIRIVSLNKKKGLDFSLLYKLYKLIITEKPDVIHTHVRAFQYIALLKTFFKKIKFLHTIHNDAFKEAGGIVIYFLKKYFFNKKKIIPIVISNEGKKKF